jgi:hypothetical protein
MNILSKFENKKEQAEAMNQTILYFALVFKGSMENFEDIRTYLLK